MEITWRHNYLGKKLIKEIKIIKEICIIVVEVLREKKCTNRKLTAASITRELFIANCTSAVTNHDPSAFSRPHSSNGQ